MASSTNIYGFNIGGNNNSFDQRGHFYRAFLDGNVSGMLVKQNSTPNMTVLVEHGSALLNKNTISASVAEIKSDTSVAIDTANTANPRIDSVVIYEDTSVTIPTVEANYWQDGAGGRFKIVSLPGTAAASPVALSDANIQSAIGAGKPFARLANITVAANSTTILNSNINNSVRNNLTASIADGAVTAPKLDSTSFGRLFARRATLTQVIPSGTQTIVVFNNVSEADGSAYNPSTGVYTATTAGLFSLSARVTMRESVAISLRILLNNTVVVSEDTPATGTYATKSINFSVRLGAGDTLALAVSQTTGSNKTIHDDIGTTNIAITRIA